MCIRDRKENQPEKPTQTENATMQGMFRPMMEKMDENSKKMEDDNEQLKETINKKIDKTGDTLNKQISETNETLKHMKEDSCLLYTSLSIPKAFVKLKF